MGWHRRCTPQRTRANAAAAAAGWTRPGVGAAAYRRTLMHDSTAQHALPKLTHASKLRGWRLLRETFERQMKRRMTGSPVQNAHFSKILLATVLFHRYTVFQRMLKMAKAMKSLDSDVLAKAISALQGHLADVPFASLEAGTPAPDPGNRPDWIGKFRSPAGERLLILDARASGQPRSARNAANQLLRYVQKFPNAVPIFSAPYISSDAADLLSCEGVNYVDLAGNCRLVFDTVYIRRQDWPSSAAQRRDLRSIYSPKAERVLRVLLQEPKRKWKVQALATAAGVSLGQASNVKLLLEEREWLSRDAHGVVLAQPAKLLEEWAQNYRFSRNAVRDFYTLDSPASVEAGLAAACRASKIAYALTGFSAAARMAPMVRYQRAMSYVVGDVDEIARRLDLKSVTSGANISLVEPYDAGVLTGSGEVDGIRTVSAIQTYLDLLSFKGRGEEAAHAILEHMVKPHW